MEATQTETTEVQPEDVSWPLWRAALNTIRKRPDFGYGMTMESRELEELLAADRETTDFAFGMMELRQELEAKDGYYLSSQTITDEESGLRKEVWQIPAAVGHEDVCKSFESKMRRYAARSFSLRSRTLSNPAASLSEDDRRRIEKSCEIASVRQVLLRRERKVVSFIKKNAPKLLEKNSAPEPVEE